MSFISNLLIVCSYIVVALALALGLQAFGGVSPFAGWIAAAVFFLFAAQVHGALNRSQENEILTDAIAAIRQSMVTLEQDVEALQVRMTDLKAHVDQTDKARNLKLVAEMKVLESLVQQLAAGVAKRVASDETAALDLLTEDEDKLNPNWHVGGFDQSNPSEFDRASQEQLLDEVRRSLEDGRVDLYLQPIVSLPQRKVRHYEALTRLRTEDGKIIMPRHYLRVAENAGLMSTIDNLLLFRCVQVVRQLVDRSRDVGVFCNISAHSLQDQNFFPQFIDFLENNEDLATRIIFEFGQETVDHCGPLELANLRRLAGLGYRFSMDRVTALSLDPKFLRDKNFRYVKAGVAVLREEREEVAALKDRLIRAGIDLVAEKIEDEATLTDVTSIGVDFGQGYLFGEPRPLRAVLSSSGAKAA